MRRLHKSARPEKPQIGRFSTRSGWDSPAPEPGEALRLIGRATARRERLRAETDALRLVDGVADGLPGIVIEDFAGVWVVSTEGTRAPDWVAEVPGWQLIFWRQLSVGPKRPPEVLSDRSGRFSSIQPSGSDDWPPVVVREGMAMFNVRPWGGYSSGLFLDQRENRKELDRRLREMAAATGRGVRVLNTFAYTCAFSVTAALAGAATESIDLSGVALDRGRENFALNGLDLADAGFCKGDVFDWLPRFAKKGRTFEVVILDPPTFSRNARGRVFRVTRDYPKLLGDALRLTVKGGTILACVNMAGLDIREFEALLRSVCAAAGRRARFQRGHVPLDFPAPPMMKSFWIDLD